MIPQNQTVPAVKLASLVNAGFRLLTPIWQQRGDYRKAIWDLAVWGAQAEFQDRRVSIYSWNTMTEIVKAGGIVWSQDTDNKNDIEIFAKENKTAADLLTTAAPPSSQEGA